MNNEPVRYAYAIPGQSSQSVYYEKLETPPTDHILMESERPLEGDYIATEEGKWTEVIPEPANPFSEMRKERNRLLDESDWIITRQKDQRDLGMGTTSISYQSFRETLEWRQQLRDLPENYAANAELLRPSFIWPPIPAEIAKEFPDYPPDLSA